MDEKYYYANNVFVEGHKYSYESDDDLIKTITRLVPEGSVLDLGCGEGGNALELAAKGFKVTCVDISDNAIAKINEEAKRRKLYLTTVCTDIENYEIDRTYDVVIMLGVLHFIPAEKLTGVLSYVKEHTKKGGLNIIDAFLQGSDCQEDSDGHFLEKSELNKLYADWVVLEEEVYSENGNVSHYVVFRK